MINPLMPEWTDKTPCDDPVYCPYMVRKFSAPSLNFSEIDVFLNPESPKVVDLLLPFDD